MPDYTTRIVRKDGLKKTVMYTFIVILALQFILDAMVVSNFKFVAFALKRQDMVAAAIKVDHDQDKVIKAKIAEINKQSVERVLSPLVIAENK